jgi:hypothetical protein
VLRYDRTMSRLRDFPITLAVFTLTATALSGVANNVRVPNLDGGVVSPISEQDDLTVLVFVATDCPIANRYAPELRRLYERFGGDVVFWLVYPSDDQSVSILREHRASYGFPFEAVRDPENKLVALSGVTVTPEVAVYAGQRLVYRGRINDRYVDFGVSRAGARMHDLRDVLDQLVAGRDVPFTETRAVGCYLPAI